MGQHYWTHAGEAAARVLSDIAVSQMASVLNDRTVDLNNPEQIISALLHERFQTGLINDLFDRVVAKARRERTWAHAQATP